MTQIIFKNIWALAAIPLAIVCFLYSKKITPKAALKFSSTDLLAFFKINLRVILLERLIYLRILAVIFLFIALAGPRIPLEGVVRETEGVDIVLAIDSSGSMLAEDFIVGGKRQNRLNTVKEVAKDFIGRRPDDRIGLITFAAFAYTVCPLTIDHAWLQENLGRVEIGAIEDGTAIGSAINSSLNRLKNSQAKSRIIILLTDGVNNAGKVSPLAAAQIAKSLGIKIYTIGVGSKGFVPFPAQDMFGRKVYRQAQIEIDETALKNIAVQTNGRYWNASNTEELKNIYKEIDSLEKSIIEETGYRDHKELFHIPLIIGMLFLLLEVVLANTWLRQIP